MYISNGRSETRLAVLRHAADARLFLFTPTMRTPATASEIACVARLVSSGVLIRKPSCSGRSKTEGVDGGAAGARGARNHSFTYDMTFVLPGKCFNIKAPQMAYTSHVRRREALPGEPCRRRAP